MGLRKTNLSISLFVVPCSPFNLRSEVSFRHAGSGKEQKIPEEPVPKQSAGQPLDVDDYWCGNYLGGSGSFLVVTKPEAVLSGGGQPPAGCPDSFRSRKRLPASIRWPPTSKLTDP